MKNQMKRLFNPPSTWAGSLVLARYSMLFILGLALPEVFKNALITFPASLLTAVCFKGFNNVVHECSHGAFSRSRPFNTWVGKILCIPLFMDFDSYKKEHASHHQYLGNYKKDIDFQAREILRHDQPFTLRRVLADIVTLRFGWLYWPRLNLKNRAHWLVMVPQASLIFILYWSGAKYALLTLTLAQVLFLPLLRYLIDIVDHGGLYKEGIDEIHKSRNFIVESPLLRGIFFPRNDCYHLIHHLYPYLPVHNFGKAHTLLMKDKIYSGLEHRAIWLAFKEQSNRTTYLGETGK